jgi:hypothetical protein
MRLLKYRQQWVGSIFCLGLVFICMLMVDAVGIYPTYFVSTIVIIVTGVVLLLSQSLFSFQVIVFVIIFVPALSPMYAWDIIGKNLFSLAAPHLQNDRALVDKTVFLYAVGAISYAAMALPRLPTLLSMKLMEDRKMVVFNFYILILIGVMTVLGSYFIEAGPTILTADYNSVLSGRLEPSSIQAAIVVTFGGFWALLFVFGRHKKWLFWGVTFTVGLWLFLHARRIEVFGIGIVLVLWWRHVFTTKSLFVLVMVFLTIQVLVGTMRDVPLLQYFKRDVPVVLKLQKKAALPGGISNVILAGLHLIDVSDKELLLDSEEFTMAHWPSAIIPNSVWKALGSTSVAWEHDTVYKKLDLEYVGGMPLLCLFYLNGGVIMVFIFGLLHGALGRMVVKMMTVPLRTNRDRGGTPSMFVAVIFVLYQFRYHWYNPQTMFRAITYSLIIFFFLSCFIKLFSHLIRQNRVVGGENIL